MLLYLHVPFCARRCSYCDFAIAVRRTVPSDAFADAVLLEWNGWRPEWTDAGPLETIYFGGGTPSRLAPNALARLIERFAADQGLADHPEITLEANPDDVSETAARAWFAAGVNRISLGVQSFDPGVLRWMHRTHDAAEPERAVGVLRAAGFRDLSLDLIYGVPENLERDWARDLELALGLQPTHLSFYALTVEPRTPLGRWVDRGVASLADEEQTANQYLVAHRALVSRGFRHYEVSNAGLPGFEARHNSSYWDRRPYLGLGPSAHSARGSRRWWNLREWESYRRAAGRRPVEGEETLTEEQSRLEELYLSLRTDRGLAASSLPRALVEQWVAADWASLRGSRVVLTPQGWLRLDALVGQVPSS